MFRCQRRPLVRSQCQLREFAYLPFEALALRDIRRRIVLKGTPPLGLVAPVAMPFSDFIGLRFQLAVGIHQLALRRRAR